MEISFGAPVRHLSGRDRSTSCMVGWLPSQVQPPGGGAGGREESERGVVVFVVWDKYGGWFVV